MENRVYKYASPDYTEKVLGSSDHVTLKYSTPDSFNDPYELFLTIDFTNEPDILAFYSEIVGELPQLPTTCFSRSPVVIPMWAHYAQALQGFVIEFDEGRLSKHLPECNFGDIDYQDDPDDGLDGLLHHAFLAQKPRHLFLLRQHVFSAAYYTKALCWAYEQERRMIVGPGDVREDNDLMLLDVPKKCVNALILGSRASPETAAAVRKRAQELDCDYFEMKIGKSAVIPYFVDAEGKPCTYDGNKIARSSKQCSSCGEPIAEEVDQCSWCQISETHIEDAARRNVFRAMNRLGILEDYMNDMRDITRRFNRDDS